MEDPRKAELERLMPDVMRLTGAGMPQCSLFMRPSIRRSVQTAMATPSSSITSPSTVSHTTTRTTTTTSLESRCRLTLRAMPSTSPTAILALVCHKVPSARHPLTACISELWYRYYHTNMSGTTLPLHTVLTDRSAVPFERYSQYNLNNNY